MRNLNLHNPVRQTDTQDNINNTSNTNQRKQYNIIIIRYTNNTRNANW